MSFGRQFRREVREVKDLVDEVYILWALQDAGWVYTLVLQRLSSLSSGRFTNAIDRLLAGEQIEEKWENLERGRKYRKKYYRLNVEKW